MSIKFEEFNPDCFVDASEADELFDELRSTTAEEFFKDAPDWDIYKKVAFENVLTYVANKAEAMKVREQGRIADAIANENKCDRIYQQLPEWARW